MGIRICAGNDVAILYRSSTGRPVNVEAFDDEEAAESFIVFVKEQREDLGKLGQIELDALRATWQTLPKCRECGVRVVKPGEHIDECASCRPECDAPGGCSARGEVMVKSEDIGERGIGLWRFCKGHEGAARAGNFNGRLR
jgi:hypothetical protein